MSFRISSSNKVPIEVPQTPVNSFLTTGNAKPTAPSIMLNTLTPRKGSSHGLAIRATRAGELDLR